MDIKKDNEMYMTIAQIAAQEKLCQALKSRLRHCQKPFNYFFRLERNADRIRQLLRI